MFRFWLLTAFLFLTTQTVSAQFFNPAKLFNQYESAVVQINTEYGSGAGFFVSTDGWVVTNGHVVKDDYGSPVSRVYVKLRDGRSFPQQDIVRSYTNDLAVIKIRYTSSNVIPLLPASENIEEGTPIAAIGHPEGETWTVTDGLVSRVKGKESSVDKSGIGAPGDVFGHSVSNNPGNSGGPLIEERGYVVGVATAGLEYSQNLNWAVNVQALRRFLRSNDIPFSELSQLPGDATECRRLLEQYRREMEVLRNERERFHEERQNFSNYQRQQESKLERDRRQLRDDKDFMQRVAGIRDDLNRRLSSVSKSENRISDRENALSRRETSLQSKVREFEREKELSRYMYPKRFSLELHSAFSFHTGEEQSFSYFGRVGAALLYRIGVDTRSYASQSNPCDRIGVGVGYAEILDSELHSIDAVRDVTGILDIDERVRFAVGRVWSDKKSWNYGNYPWVITVTYYFSQYGYPVGLTVGSLSTERFDQTGFTVGLTAGVGLNMLRI